MGTLPLLLFHEDFWHGFFCYKALAKSLCVFWPFAMFLLECQSWLLSSLLLSSQFAAGPRTLHQQVLTPCTFPYIPNLLGVMHAFSSTYWRIYKLYCFIRWNNFSWGPVAFNSKSNFNNAFFSIGNSCWPGQKCLLDINKSLFIVYPSCTLTFCIKDN